MHSIVRADGADSCAAEPWQITPGVVFLFAARLMSCMIVAVAAP
jgi:hypothetical protein